MKNLFLSSWNKGPRSIGVQKLSRGPAEGTGQTGQASLILIVPAGCVTPHDICPMIQSFKAHGLYTHTHTGAQTSHSYIIVVLSLDKTGSNKLSLNAVHLAFLKNHDPSKMFLFMGKMSSATLHIGCNCVPAQWCFWKLLCKVAGFQKQSPFPLRFPVTSNTTQMWHGVAIPPLFVLEPIELFKMFAVPKRTKRREKRAYVRMCAWTALKVFEHPRRT